MNDFAQKPSLEEKIGQLIAVGFHGTALNDKAVQKIMAQIEKGLLGGIIIYRYNIENRQQLEDLLTGVQAVPSRHPPFVMVDQEGGRVQRIHRGNGFIDFSSAADVAANMSLEDACRHYGHMGSLLRHTGFNFNFAPCVDLDGPPSCEVIGKLERSYSPDPKIVSDYARAMIDGLNTNGIISCLKHFPGHGRAQGDSHMGLVDIGVTWGEDELVPYKNLISKGCVNAVMTAHLIHQGVDEDMPATFSSRWINRLRDELGFEGVVVSDDLHMGAILRHYSLDEIVFRGLDAGLDILIFSNNPLAAEAEGIRHDPETEFLNGAQDHMKIAASDLPNQVVEIVKKSMAAGRLDPAIIDRAYGRVTKLKEGLQP